MPTFPLPLFGAVLLAVFAALAWRREQLPPLTIALLLACAAQSLIIALTQHYDVQAVRPLQVIGAALLPALVWAAFREGGDESGRGQLLMQLLPAPLLAILAMLFAPQLLDVAIPAWFLIQGLRLWVATGSEKTLPQARLGSGDLPALLWRSVAISLMLSALMDVLIVTDAIATNGAWRGWITTFGASLNLIVLGALFLGRDVGDPPPLETAVAGSDAPQPPEVADDDATERKVLMARLDELMRQRQAWTDPDLTLGRLARRLGVPAKRLSATINSEHGENVSRYINRYRIEHACELLREDPSITAAMLGSGFSTKSNFNREFLRVTGGTPSEWRDGHQRLVGK